MNPTVPAPAPVLLACVGTGPNAAQVVRGAARLATQSGGRWHAVYVETPRLRRLPEEQRQRILERLRLAQELGASTAVIDAADPAQALADYARAHGCGMVVLGRTRNGVRAFTTSMLRRVAGLAPGLDVVELAAADAPGAEELTPDAEPRAPLRRYLLAVGASAMTALVTLPLLATLELANVAMLMLLSVVLVAIRFGRGPAAAASLTAFGALVLAAPRGELRYTVALLVMLAVGWITAGLTASLREQARASGEREARTRALYEFARELSGVLQAEQVFEITARFVQRTFDAQSIIMLPGPGGRLAYPDAAGVPPVSVLDMGAAQWAFDHSTPAGAGTDTLPSNHFIYLPLIAPMRTRGVLLAWSPERRWVLVPEQRELLDAFAALAAIALERVHYVEVAQDATVRMESERLRNSLLSALSHDLRTPLTSLVGLSESLSLSKPTLAQAQLELAHALRDEAKRMSVLVANLLDMARIESGTVKLNMEWQSIEEVIGSALRAARWQLAGRDVATALAPELPLVRFDAMLVERVLCNLLENACKYTPASAGITVRAHPVGDVLEVAVRDSGPGLPRGREEALFEKFTRGDRESPIPGVGLGLAICRAIVHAHGGTIRAYNDAGAVFAFTLPLGKPPAMPSPEPDQASAAS
ncbi:MAG: ATP-binding protein [Telluria sp.]